MKSIKKTLIISSALLAHLGLLCQPQQPFSPCSTDTHTASCNVVVHNNLTEALGDYLGPVPAVSDNDIAQNYTDDASDTSAQADEEIAHIQIEVNKKLLRNNEDVVIDIAREKALKITLTGDMRTMMGYLIKHDLLKEIDTPVTRKIKDWTVGALSLLAKINLVGSDPERVYENNKAKVLALYAQTYRLLNWFGKCKIEIVLDAQKLRNEFAECADEPAVISFHRIIHEVLERMDEPDRFKYNGSIFNPSIQII